jgi:hypothetical protein
MKTSELRLGSLVQFYSDIRAKWVLDTVSAEYFKTPELKNVKGVSITEKWLQNFGFEKAPMPISGKYYFSYKTEKLNFTVVGNELAIAFKDKRLYGEIAEFYLEVNFLHQLQNIIYALTGEELYNKAGGENLEMTLQSMELETTDTALRIAPVSGELAAFLEFIKDNYSIEIPERVLEEWKQSCG